MASIIIAKKTSAADVKKIFNTNFPFLKIEFFKKQHKNLEGSKPKDMINFDFIINFSKTNKLVIDDNMSVSALEKEFKEKHQLSIQIFRKSFKSWLETTLTDEWTLEKQNQQGKELSEM